MNNKTKAMPLNFEGVESFTNDTYYDIMNGYYRNEIKDEYTKVQLQKAIDVIEALAEYLQENELVG